MKKDQVIQKEIEIVENAVRLQGDLTIPFDASLKFDDAISQRLAWPEHVV